VVAARKRLSGVADQLGWFYSWCSDFRIFYQNFSRTDFYGRCRVKILTAKLKDSEQRKAQLNRVARIDKVRH
jgi:hypothetical protein